MNLNKAFIIGRLAADPETRTTATGQSVVTLRVATNRVWNDRNTNEKREQVEFHTVIAWGRLAEIAQKYLKKGQMALFEGRLQTRSWQGQDGQKRYRTEIVAENLQLGPKSDSRQNDDYGPNRGTGRPASSLSPRPSSNKKVEIEEDDIPIIDEESPISSVSKEPATNEEVEETEIDLKDIPF